MKPLTLEEWTAQLEEKRKADPDYTLGPDDCRQILATCIAELYEPILIVLFQDERVKNYFALPFAFEDKHEYDFEVCFKRKDGEYPPNLKSRLAALEEQLAEKERQL